MIVVVLCRKSFRALAWSLSLQRALGNLAGGELLAQLHEPDLAYHFHGDRLLSLLLNFSAGQLSTLVNFESALPRLDGQFSVGDNNYLYFDPVMQGGFKSEVQHLQTP